MDKNFIEYRVSLPTPSKLNALPTCQRVSGLENHRTKGRHDAVILMIHCLHACPGVVIHVYGKPERICFESLGSQTPGRI